MILNEQSLKKILKNPLAADVYFYYSLDEYPVRKYAARTLSILAQQEDDAELTKIEGPAPDIGAAVAAAGTISLFGTKRIVYLPMVEPASMSDTDLKDLCDLMQSLENAVLVITAVFKEERLLKGKKVKQIIEASEQAGVAAYLTAPGPNEIKIFVEDKAHELDTEIPPQAISELVDRCGTDPITLENELEKLAAMCGYTEITPELIRNRGTRNIEADVFDMIRLMTARNRTAALEKLNQLFELQNDPLKISAAVYSSFVDMYRVKCGADARKNHTVVHKDFAYKGSDFRLRMAGKSAARYTARQLQKILTVLLDLDISLKSSAADNEVLMETALCEIMQIGERR